jgi:hypothetical protein
MTNCSSGQRGLGVALESIKALIGGREWSQVGLLILPLSLVSKFPAEASTSHFRYTFKHYPENCATEYGHLKTI